MVRGLVLLFTSLLAIPLARQSCLDATLFTWFQVVGVTLDFLDDVLLLNLTLEPAQRIFERLAFLYANLCQLSHTSQPASLAVINHTFTTVKDQAKFLIPQAISFRLLSQAGETGVETPRGLQGTLRSEAL